MKVIKKIIEVVIIQVHDQAGHNAGYYACHRISARHTYLEIQVDYAGH